jgi:Ca2+-binding RTX toxin-like protein
MVPATATGERRVGGRADQEVTMSDDIYDIHLLAPAGQPTVTVSDDGTGTDWLVLSGTYSDQSDIRLSWSSVNGVSTQASGSWGNGGVGNRLIVSGLIENVRGSDSSDFIQGNELGNELWGDSASNSVGGNDVIWGGDGNDIIYGGAGNDELKGDAGDDILVGGVGRDNISGGSGVDRIEGGTGADVLSGGGDAGDTVSYIHSNAAVSVDLTFGAATSGHGGHAEGDIISGFSDILGSNYGDTLRDTVAGTIAFGYNDNSFWGKNGHDLLEMGGGADTGYGGNGNDRIYGGDGDDALYGGADNDRLYGGNGIDLLHGGAGADRIVGGAGGDLLTGGRDADTFIFSALADSFGSGADRDKITDFNFNQGDRLDLSGIDANVGAGGDQAFLFIGATGFHGVAGELRIGVTGTGLVVQGDVDGDGAADVAILLQGLTALDPGAFIL